MSNKQQPDPALEKEIIIHHKNLLRHIKLVNILLNNWYGNILNTFNQKYRESTKEKIITSFNKICEIREKIKELVQRNAIYDNYLSISGLEIDKLRYRIRNHKFTGKLRNKNKRFIDDEANIASSLDKCYKQKFTTIKNCKLNNGKECQFIGGKKYIKTIKPKTVKPKTIKPKSVKPKTK